MAGKVNLPLNLEDYERVVGYKFGSFGPAVLNEYNLADYKSRFMAYADEVTDDSPLGCAVSSLSQTFSSLATVFRYEFNDAGAPTPGPGALGLPFTLGAYHGSELQYLFKMTQLPGPQTPAQRSLSEQMIQYWTNFVQRGDPNGPGLIEWPPYDAYTQKILSLRPEGNTLITNFDANHHCAFWAAAPGPPFE